MRTEQIKQLPQNIRIEIALKLPDHQDPDEATPGPEPRFLAWMQYDKSTGDKWERMMQSSQCFASHEDSVAASPEDHMRKLLERIQAALLPLCSKPDSSTP